jgi:UDP-2-acetamido-2-deoxy-ribo-hexuluronate aminotransferase
MDFIDLKRQYRMYKDELSPLLSDIMENARFILGKEVGELETKLAGYVNSKHAIGMSSGTDALLVALLAAGVKPGDEVITVPFTFIATAEVISFIGAKPVFVDISDDDYNIDIASIEAKITSRTKAIIPVSLYGQSPDMDKLNEIAEKHNIFVLEDACQSFGAIYKGRKSANLSDAAAISFFPSKPLGCYGDGGMVFTNDDELALRIRQIANHGQTERYIHKYIGINGRLDTMQAAVLLVKFAHFEEEARLRFEAGKRYNELLKDAPVISPKIMDYTDRHIFAQYSIRVNNRDEVQSYLRDKGIPTAVHYAIPIHLQEAYSELGHKKGGFPVCERVAGEIMSLPMHPFITPEEQKTVADAIKVSAK